MHYLITENQKMCHPGSFSRRVRNNKKEDEEDDSEAGSNSCRQCSLSLSFFFLHELSLRYVKRQHAAAIAAAATAAVCLWLTYLGNCTLH